MGLETQSTALEDLALTMNETVAVSGIRVLCSHTAEALERQV